MCTRIKVFVLQHKASPLPSCFANDKIYIPIQCGRTLGTTIPGTIGDDTGENISALNHSVNEMTGLYWVAKHFQEIGNPEFIGFDHYRRFLNWKPHWLTPHTVIARRWFSWRTLRAHFAFCHPVSELERFSLRFRQVFNTDYADYHAYWNTHWFYICNMFIMHRDDFLRYADFILRCINILRELERERPILSDNVAMQRVPGYILERMTSYWIWHEKKHRRITVRKSTITHFNEDNLPTRIDKGFLGFLRIAH